MTEIDRLNSRIIDSIALCFSLYLIAAAGAAMLYIGDTPASVLAEFRRILISPCPLVTDYFELGSLPAALLNSGLCGLAMFFFLVRFPGPSYANMLAGYFLVVAHCFYGLNFLNMWPCFLAALLYMKLNRLSVNDNLHICMFCTCFSPFVSELLFRYTLGQGFELFSGRVTLPAILLTVLFTFFVSFVAPAILPGAHAWHKGYNLYNGGLAFGILGFFLYNLMYRSMGAMAAPVVPHCLNPVYESFGRDYFVFSNIFYSVLFLSCLACGWYLNNRSFNGLRLLIRDSGYQSNFARKYGMPLCLINIGLYGFMILAYIDAAVTIADGAGFTGPTFGIVLAALTFSALGQHPSNVWPIFAGYALLYLTGIILNHSPVHNVSWTISTQGYLNGVAFATGLCPIVGRYGRRAGIAAGFLCAAMCTATSALHGGLMLYNGGFTAGITALLLLPVLEHYSSGPRENDGREVIDLRDMMTIRTEKQQENTAGKGSS